MSARSGGPAPPILEVTARTARTWRRNGAANLLRMGHCAPTVMQTLLDASGTEAPWLVKLTAGLPGGIGNTGGECGGVTAPLVLIGLRHGLEPDDDGLPTVVAKGRDLLRQFAALEGTTACRDIRRDARIPLRCIGVVREAPVLCAKCLCGDGAGALTAEQRRAHGRLFADWHAKDFHCARSVLRHLDSAVAVDEQVLAAGSAFMGGTVFTGMTCSALTAGVMALGLATGAIENSRLRVLRMIATMAVGGDAFADRLNAFNRTMNLGHRLSQWFAAEFGSTQCRAITGCDFSRLDDVDRYLDGGGTTRCQVLAQRVATRVQAMVTGVNGLGRPQ
ncbi:C-GCAxxG-C-C family protein [Ideonella sp. A 288]|uniref:C-GCAxxG-C-C family protein n=1 Tax=Ideonella sp. A 288 TaxID=1962181 RepID=UPI000B4AD1F0|nr:C-GCAxxG-C-C family protein [Ideonella sp. A 288]